MPRVRVAIRLKPEEPANWIDSLAVRRKHQDTPDGLDTVELAVEGQRYEFSFDRVFQADATQEAVFSECAVLLSNEVLEGYNGCIFAYGQTGAGKTYTMSGPSTNDYAHRGLVSRTINYLFDKSRLLAQMGDSISLRLSVLEIYNEVLIDLLRADNPTTIGSGVPYSSSMAPSKQVQSSTGRTASAHATTQPNGQSTTSQDAGKLNIVDTPAGVLIPSLFVLPLANEEEANSLILEAYSNRVVAEHQLNKRSSRSHVIYTIYVTRTRVPQQQQQQQHQKERDAEPEVSQSKLHLVDLAGSERVIKTQSAGVVQREANYINKSLSFLEQVVLALTQSKRDHIPYRQSKLTFILKDSLGGNSNTYMIACVWPHAKHAWETLSTLRFSSRMSTIENTPIRNNLVDRSESGPATQRLLAQIDALKRELSMRDVIAGRDPWLPQLSNKQKELVFKQVTEVMSTKPAVSSAYRGSSLLTADNNASAASVDVCVQSLSHVRLLVDCMKTMVWEACGQNSARVDDVIRAVVPSSDSAISNHFNQRSSGYANGSTNSRSEKSPAKRATGAGSELSVDVPGTLVRSMSDSHSPMRAAPQLQSQSAQKPKQPVNKPVQQPFSTPKRPSQRPGESARNLIEGNAGAADSSWMNALRPPDDVTTPMRPPADEVTETEAEAEAEVPSDTAVVTLTFDEFKASAEGIELHNAYEDCKTTLKNNKIHQKEVIALINGVKARIDVITSQLQSVKDKSLELNYQSQREMEALEQASPSQATNTDLMDDPHIAQLTELQTQILALESGEAEAKKEYRAAHAELQALRQQAVDVQQLKQRAMAALVAAYDVACSQR